MARISEAGLYDGMILKMLSKVKGIVLLSTYLGIEVELYYGTDRLGDVIA